MSEENITKMPEPDGLGRISIVIDLDTGGIQMGFNQPGVSQLLTQEELGLIVNRFYTGCMIGELRRRKAEKEDSGILVPGKEIMLKITRRNEVQ